jgi:hypothetical protein
LHGFCLRDDSLGICQDNLVRLGFFFVKFFIFGAVFHSSVRVSLNFRTLVCTCLRNVLKFRFKICMRWILRNYVLLICCWLFKIFCYYLVLSDKNFVLTPIEDLLAYISIYSLVD